MDQSIIYAALIAAVPATFAALAAWRSSASTGRKVKTANGMTLGEIADANSLQLTHLVGQFDQHCKISNERFIYLEERAHDHEHLATAVQEGCGIDQQDG